MKTKHWFPLAAVVASCTLLAGCAHKGPGTMRADVSDYNRAIVDTTSQQLLLNIVRMRYNDPWLFMSVGSVVAQYEFKGTADAAASFQNGAGFTGGAADLGLSYTERPTISYSPVQGADFARDLFTPVRPEILFMLSGTGWEVKTLLLACVESINGLKNAHGGPTWMFAPDVGSFKEFLEVMQKLQRADAYNVRVVKGEQDHWVVTLHLDEPRSDEVRKAQVRFKELLGLDLGQDTFRILAGAPPAAPDEIKIQARPMLGIYYFFAQAVEVSDKHVQDKIVLVTRNPDGSRYDWSQLMGKLFKVHCQETEPKNAFLKVRHRGYWFYIADDDPFSKQTYSLLNTVNLLQTSGSKGVSPLLTISAGP